MVTTVEMQDEVREIIEKHAQTLKLGTHMRTKCVYM